jgi:fibronectin type 3 domain-containing protein
MQKREAMKLRLIPLIICSCLGVFLGQGLQGHVTIAGQATVSVTGHSVTLTWNGVQNATSYNVYRGNTHGGPYTKVAAAILTTTYTDVQLTHNQTLYYVTTAVNGGVESAYSNETVAVVP